MQRAASDSKLVTSTRSASSITVATMPRTSEVMWNGMTSLPFVLKRKRNGAILVTRIKPQAAASPTVEPPLTLRLGSELKLVGGFPVQQLTLSEVKKVMLHAPKPVSLVFLNHDHVVLDNMSFLSEYRGSFENEFEYDSTAPQQYPPLRESREWPAAPPTSQSQSQTEFYNTAYEQYNPFDSSSSSQFFDTPTRAATITTNTDTMTTSISSGSSRRRRRSPDDATSSHPRKVSKLKQALERMNELLNRPVRRSGLNLAAGKSIVV